MRPRELDDAALPVAAARLDRLLAFLTGRWHAVRASMLRRSAQLRGGVVGSRTGSVVAAVVVVAVLAGVGGAAYYASGSRHSTPQHANGALVGPHTREHFKDYRSAATRNLAQVAAHDKKDVYALVDLSRYLTVGQAAALFGR